MRSLLWLTVLLCAQGLLFGLGGTIDISHQPNAAALVSDTPAGLTVNYTVGELAWQETDTPRGRFTELSIAGYATTNRTGLPQLPLLRQIIRVPLQAQVLPRVTQSSSSQVSLAGLGISHPLLPKQESQSKSADPATVPFAYDREFYNGTGWTGEPIVKVEEIGMLRGARLVALDFVPVRYNPATAQLEVTASATVEVAFAGADWAATDELYERYYSPVFEPALSQALFNYETPRTTLNRYPLGLIIIAPANYEATLQPFINWKRQQGYNVTFATTAVTGTTTTAIKAWLQNIWNTATTENPAPSYLLLVGDTGQIPAWTGNTDSGHVTDLSYVRLQGTDYVPEMYFGRFSATSTTQVQTYVDKTLMYEKYAMPDPSYLSHTVLIAGMDSYYAQTHGNGQINYGKNNYFGESTAPAWTPYGPYNIRNHMYPYPASGSSDSAILADMSAGLGFINYTAHGSETSWSDPSVNIANINAMTNVNKYFVAVGNCCLTNHFNTAECFGEAITRTAGKGAVAYIGGTNSTYWDEDFYWAVGYKTPITSSGPAWMANRIGAYDALFHYHDEAVADWAGTLGAQVLMGNLAVVQANSSRANYYWEIYSIMGDPSLIPYMGIPTANTAQYAPTVQIGVGTMQITADPYTFVGISQNDVLHGSGMTDGSGNLTLNFIPFTTPGPASLVLTRSLRQPIIATVEVTSGAGPYIIINSMFINDSNNSIPEAGETLYLEPIINNVGTQAAQAVTATVTTANPYVNIINNTTTLASVAVNTPYTIGNTFQVEILNSIPDQEEVEFTFTFTDGSNNTWSGTRSITVNAPDLTFSAPTFFDPNNNGAFEQGETITVTFNLSNTGHAATSAAQLNVVINSPHATTTQSVFTLPGFNVGTVIPITLDINISASAPTGGVISVGLALTAGAQLVNSMFALPVGAVGDGFEIGSIGAGWQNVSTIPWTIVSGTTNAHTGNYCVRSGAIGHNGITELSVTLNVGMAGEISFWRKVSSESGYDLLKFYIDSDEQGSWSGNLPWGQQTYAVAAGQHTFRWSYQKDYSSTSGYDCAWIDDIVFPISGDANAPIYYQPTTSLNYSGVELHTIVSQDLVIRNLGPEAMTGTINAPSLFGLHLNGVSIVSPHTYSIPAHGNATLMVSVYLNSATNFNGELVITSNDPNYPSQQVALSVSSVTNDDNTAPAVTALEGNYPNPFNPVTAIRYSVKEAGPVTIKIYNTKGQLVRTLVNAQAKAGSHSQVWDGRDDAGKPVSSGVYMYRMTVPGFAQTRKMMLMK